MALLTEFREFIKRGNVIDLAVAVVLGTAFNDIVKKVVDKAIMPLLNLVLPQTYDAAGKPLGWAAWTLGPVAIGEVLAAVLHFVIVAFVVFLVVNKFVKRLMFRKEEAKSVAPAEDVLLLREIRDLLRSSGAPGPR